MKCIVTAVLCTALVVLSACGQESPPPSSKPAPSPQSEVVRKTPSTEMRQFYGVGVVTKIVMENPYDKSVASVELDHEEIEGLMPAMIMEFNVKDRSVLNNLKIGDKVDFTIDEIGGTEVISAIKKK